MMLKDIPPSEQYKLNKFLEIVTADMNRTEEQIQSSACGDVDFENTKTLHETLYYLKKQKFAIECMLCKYNTKTNHIGQEMYKKYLG